MIFYGSYVKTVKRDELTGETVFLVRPTEGSAVPVSEYGKVLCIGYVPQYSEHVPLEIEGRFGKPRNEETQPVFHVQRIIEHAVCRDDAIQFLSSAAFYGVGAKTAEKIVDIIGFDFIRDGIKPVDISNLADGGVSSETVRTLEKTITAFGRTRELLSLLVPIGGTYQDAYNLYRGLGDRAMDFLADNPYEGASYGLSYSVCEKLAKQRGLNTFDDVRLKALIGECFRVGEQQGNTALTFPAIKMIASMVERRSGAGYKTPVFHLLAALLSEEAKYVAYKDYSEEWKVSRRAMYDKESNIASIIRWLSVSSAKRPVDASLIEKIEAENGITYAPEQMAAFELLGGPGIKILTGGPGTGKTTVLNGLIQYYGKIHPTKPIRLGAPTANAARKMRESTGRSAYTVHKMLGLNHIGAVSQSAKEQDIVLSGLIIVDEASMLDVEIFNLLLSRIAPGSILLLVGDEEQLESVGPGNILGDLLENQDIPSRRLVKVFRQGETSSILKNGIMVREGALDLITDEQTQIMRVQNNDAMQFVISELMASYYKQDRPWATRLLTPVRSRKYTIGSIQLNKLLQERFNNKNADIGVTYGQKEFRLGDPVQFIKNNYKHGYINGDVGIISSIVKKDGASCVTVALDDHSVDISGHLFEDLDLAYAGTVHKAQGGECDVCIVVLPSAPISMLYKKLIYVAMTRARQKNIIVSEGNALEKAILNHGYRHRETSLGYLMRRGG